MTAHDPEQMAAYRLDTVVHRMGDWILARMLKQNTPFLAKISPPLPFDSDGQGQALLRKLRAHCERMRVLTPIEVSGYIYEPAIRRLAVIYPYSEAFQCWSQEPPDETQAAFRVWTLCCQDQFDAGRQLLDLEDVWIDRDGRAWIDPTEPKRLTAAHLGESESAFDWKYKRRCGDIPRRLDPLLKLSERLNGESPAARFYECSGREPAEGSRPMRKAAQSPEGVEHADFEDLSLIHISRCFFDEKPGLDAPSAGLEWFNGWFWEPFEFRIEEHLASAHDIDTGRPKARIWFVLVIKTIAGCEVQFTNLLDLSVRAQSEASDRSVVVPLDSQGQPIREGMKIEIDGVSGSEATVLEIAPDASMRLSFEDFWTGPESQSLVTLRSERTDHR